MTSDGRGQLYAGTSGFAYAGWAPRFYPRACAQTSCCLRTRPA